MKKSFIQGCIALCLSVALGTAIKIHADQAPTRAPAGPSIQKLTTLTGTLTGSPLLVTTPGWILTYQQESGPILRVQGIEYDEVSEHTSVYGINHYSRPEKPDTVKVTLYTKDGRQWHAAWVEDKP